MRGVVPSNINRKNSSLFFPNYLHYKIQEININNFEKDGKILKSVWSGLKSHYPEGHQFLSVYDFFLENPSGRYKGQKLFNSDDGLPECLKIL